MSEKESLADKFQKLSKTTQHTFDEIKIAWQETSTTFYDWECINEGVLDFDLIEKDVTKIQDKIKQDNLVILGTQFTINKLEKFIDIKTYTQKGDKFFEYNPERGKFKNLINLPSDVETQLEKEGSVTIQPSLSYKEEIKESDIPQEQFNIMKKEEENLL